jgi:hypothetical protein
MKFYSTVLIAFLLLGLCLLEKRAKDQTRKPGDQLSESVLLADEAESALNTEAPYNQKSQATSDARFTSMIMSLDTTGSAGIAQKAILHLSANRFITSNQ